MVPDLTSTLETARETDDDLVLPFRLDAGAVRGRLVRLGPVLDALLGPHDQPPAVAGAVGQAVALAATLANMLKYEGVFTLQIQGDGPISLLVADVTSAGDLRAHARCEATRLPTTDAAPMPTTDAAPMPTTDAAPMPGGAGPHHGVLPVNALFGTGYLAFTVDQGPDTDRYQGIVALEGATLTDCAHAYFRQSEQLDTAIHLAVRPPTGPPGGDGDSGTPGWRGGALMIQRMPIGPNSPIFTAEQADEAWRTAVLLQASLTDAELLDPDLAPGRLLHRLFHGEGLILHAPHRLRARCRCSRARVERTLRSFPRTEIADLRDPDTGLVVVTCAFCTARHDFDAAALDGLYEGETGTG